MPKRSRSGVPRGSLVLANGRRTVRTFNKRVSKRSIRRVRGGRIATNYTFSRWLISQPAANITVTGGTYSTVNSVLSCNQNVSEIDVGQVFTLGSLPNPTEFSTLFDQYCIRKVTVQLKLINVPEASSAPLTNNSNYGNFYPTIWYCSDLDDAAPYTLAAIKEVQGVKHKVLFPNRELNMNLSPTQLTQMYRSALTTGYAPKRAAFVDIAATDIPHYANKFVIDLEGFNTAVLDPNFLPKFKLNFRIYFQCKGVR